MEDLMLVTELRLVKAELTITKINAEFNQMPQVRQAVDEFNAAKIAFDELRQVAASEK